MLRKTLQAGIAGAVIAGGSLLVPVLAFGATTTTGVGVTGVKAPTAAFLKAQTALELQLSDRTSQLVHLSADVKGAKTLTAAHATVLTTNITAAQASISMLSVKVPTDTTMAQIKADRQTMLKDNRVYAVLTPQVFLTIEADGIAMQVASFQASELTLQSSVNVLVGQPGYKNAMNHYVAFVKQVNAANEASANVTTNVLAQTPSDYPGDTHVFVSANKSLRGADVDLAYATYDETVIGLASGGYTGS